LPVAVQLTQAPPLTAQVSLLTAWHPPLPSQQPPHVAAPHAGGGGGVVVVVGVGVGAAVHWPPAQICPSPQQVRLQQLSVQQSALPLQV
jgi:hypothetical protein